jgi:hypothetical protein
MMPPPPAPPDTPEGCLVFCVCMIIIFSVTYSWHTIRSRKIVKIEPGLGCPLLVYIVFAAMSLLSILFGS